MGDAGRRAAMMLGRSSLIGLAASATLLVAMGRHSANAQQADPAAAAPSPEPAPAVTSPAAPVAPLPVPQALIPQAPVPQALGAAPAADPAAPLLDSVTRGVALAPLAPTPPPAAPPAPAIVDIDQPRVIDTARLSGRGISVALFGVAGLEDPPQGLQVFIQANGNHVTCDPRAGGTYTCLLPDRTDIALVALANGAARALTDAPDSYHQQEDAAQAARRGVWQNLPPPPVTLIHPAARTTALIAAADANLYPLDGLDGLPGRPAQDLQGYITSHGDSLLCQPQGGAGNFLCTLPDGTDIGKVALVNGAARVTPDAPDSYRLQQSEAIANRRGIWATEAPPPMQAVATTYVLQPEDLSGPIVYVGDQPTAVIDGVTAFFVYGDGLGWGYYDHDHHWRGAPGRFADHLERFHPDGRGLRGYGGRGPGFGGDHFGRAGPAAFGERAGYGRPSPGVVGERGGYGRPSPGVVGERGGYGRPSPGFQGARPEMARGGAEPGLSRGGVPQAYGRGGPAGAPPGFGRGGPAPALARGGAPALGGTPGGFARPGAPAGAFGGRPAAPQMAMARAAAPARAAPAAHCSGKHC